MRTAILLILVTFVLSNSLLAQSPGPVTLQAATPVTQSSKAPATSDSSASPEAALKILLEIKAANEETLRKQAAMLEKLDELEKAAAQLKIFARRG
jgi:hypothetical protein